MPSELVNHVWQSTLTTVAIAALVRILRDNGANARYWLWWAASVKFLVPFSLLVMLGGALGGTRAPLFELTDWHARLGRIAEPIPASTPWTPLAVTLLVPWVIGFAVVVGAWLVRAHRLRAILRASVPTQPAATQTGPEVRSSAAPVEPALVGVVRPVLLLPQGIAARLAPAQLDAVLAHELAHWRRRDNLTALVHMLVEAVFWFHPLVWWIGARLVEERERACDEAVLRAGHDGCAYAEGILNVCEGYVAAKLKCAAGVSGADLKRRIVAIASYRATRELPMRKKVLLASAAVAAALAPVVFGIGSGRAAAQSDRDVIPLVRIAPDYPPEALALGIEGYAHLEFTVNVRGVPEDIVVVESSAPEFEVPSVEALARWRYEPLVRNGQPVERRGVHTIIRYQVTKTL
jgi:TonB family protein